MGDKKPARPRGTSGDQPPQNPSPKPIRSNIQACPLPSVGSKKGTYSSGL